MQNLVLNSGQPVFNQGVALYIEDLRVSFDGFQALGGLSLTVNVGELRCVIGPNGAGKTTLFNIVTGIYAQTSGQVLLEGNDISRVPAEQLASRGLVRTFQNIELFGSMTVEDNLLLGGWRPLKLGQRVEVVFDTTATSCKLLSAAVDPELVGVVSSTAPLTVAGLVLVKSKTRGADGRMTLFPEDLAVGMRCRAHCFANGLIMRAVGDRMIIAPPLTMTHAQIDEMLALVRKALDLTWAELQARGWV